MAKVDKKNLNSDDAQVYSFLEVHRGFLTSLIILCFFCFLFLTSTIWAHLVQETHWLFIALSSCAIGSILMLFPSTEEWVYKPWQKAPEMIEHHEEGR